MFYKRFRRFLKILYFSVTIKTIDTSHEEPPGVARRAAIVGLKNWNKRSTFALEFLGAFVALGTDVLAWDFYFVQQAVPTEVFRLVLSLWRENRDSTTTTLFQCCHF